ncbi:Eukaryotic translation initiation factor 5A-1 [Halotydeus destructor]|nr:Eukaryotic translation initiation factor 5A-1 [Halotydeus destructor]
MSAKRQRREKQQLVALRKRSPSTFAAPPLPTFSLFLQVAPEERTHAVIFFDSQVDSQQIVNMADELEEFHGTGNAGASETTPLQCSALRKGGYVMIKGHPCKVVDMSTSKTGKHGHAKVNFAALDIFTGKKYEDICPSTHNVDVPNVTRNDLTLIDISDDKYCSLMDDAGNIRENLKLPDGELGTKIEEEFRKEGNTVIVTVMAAVKQEQIIAAKNANN